MSFETRVKLSIYQTIAETAKVPDSVEVAAALGSSVAEVEEAIQALAAKRLLVLEPDTDSKIRMAPPFSGVETSFLVAAGGRSYYANCAWDALGVAAALHSDADISAVCGDCGEPIALQVRDGRPLPRDCAVHFAVPAAHWWDDIIYT